MQQVPQHCYRYSCHYLDDVPVIEEELEGDPPRAVRPEAGYDWDVKARMNDLVHVDCVSALAVLDYTESRLLISASRDGAIKAWR